jgi:hypothetical protein
MAPEETTAEETILERVRYRGWSGRLRPAWFAAWPIALTGLRLVLRRKLFWALLGLGLMHFLFLFATIYLGVQIRIESPQLSRFVGSILASMEGGGRTYRNFMAGQGTIIMIALAFAGELLVGNDFREGGLVFYLSRRVGRRHYVAGKLLSIAMLVGMMTTAPALVLYAEFGLLGDPVAYFRENPRILLAILGYGLAMAASLSLLLFALAAWLQKTAPLVMAWAGIFLLLPALGEILHRARDDRRWLLLRVWGDIRLIGDWCFGTLNPKDQGDMVWSAAAVVLAVSLVSAIAIFPRIRAVKVVA